jgi:hypothetical protein
MQQQPEKRGWWSRNWKWFVPVGCLSMLALVAVVIVLIVTLVFGALKSSDVYKQAMTKATANPTVISELGQPIESGWMVSGSISVNGPQRSRPRNPDLRTEEEWYYLRR